MARLPQPGSDQGTWGNVLNEYLGVSHDENGQLKNDSVTNASIVNGAITANKLATTSLPGVNQSLIYNGSGLAWSTSSGNGLVPDADSETKGLVRLAGDLAGSASNPTVPGLATKEPSVPIGVASQFYRGDKTWQTLNKAAVGLSQVDNTSDALKPISSATQAALNAKLNNITGLVSAGTNVTLAGSGTSASPYVINASGGGAGSAAWGSISGSISSQTDLQSALSSKAADAEVVHIAGNETITGSKDFNGGLTVGGNSVITSSDARLTDNRTPIDNSVSNVKLANGSVSYTKISAGAATAGQVLSYDGTNLAWTTNTLDGSVSDATPSVKGVVQLAGDLSGTAGSPTVSRLNGVSVSGSPSAGQVLTATSSTAASWQAGGGGGGGAVSSVSGRTGAVTLTSSDVGLANVNNTSDAAKPISTATQTALNAKAPLASPAFTGTPTGITKAHVGLGNVDNTSDASKPISSATQTALNSKVSGTGIVQITQLTQAAYDALSTKSTTTLYVVVG